MPTPPDPAAFFRSMLGEWEKMANEFGGTMLKSEEVTRAMHGASSAAMQGQAATHQMMEKALAAANMPSRAEIEDLSARLARMEASLARIETALGGSASASPARPKPSRGRTPAEKKG